MGRWGTEAGLCCSSMGAPLGEPVVGGQRVGKGWAGPGAARRVGSKEMLVTAATAAAAAVFSCCAAHPASVTHVIH